MGSLEPGTNLRTESSVSTKLDCQIIVCYSWRIQHTFTNIYQSTFTCYFFSLENSELCFSAIASSTSCLLSSVKNNSAPGFSFSLSFSYHASVCLSFCLCIQLYRSNKQHCDWCSQWLQSAVTPRSSLGIPLMAPCRPVAQVSIKPT